MKPVYMDYNATTPLHPAVQERMKAAMDLYGNPSSMHTQGRQAREEIEAAREEVASFVGARPKNIIFVGSGSEANNTIFNLFPCRHRDCSRSMCGKTEIVTTKIEHPCILESAKKAELRGVVVRYLDVDRFGRINLEQLAELVTEKTALVSIMMVNNEIGTIQDLVSAGKIIHAKNALFHTDAVQALGKIPIDVSEIRADFMSFSAHKIYGPKGIGALYVADKADFCPFILGGHQEQGRRAGTENTLGIVGMGEAVRQRKQEMEEEGKRLWDLRRFFISELRNRVDDVSINGHETEVIPGTVNVSFRGVEGESVLLYLDMFGIAVSTGSACSTGSLDPSHVLLATAHDAEMAHGSIRFSFGRDTTQEDVIYVLDHVESTITKLREISTVYRK
ncbi:cysteine desulfurase family protein [Chitinivibrio alkaliphilus]|uniref:cysteine desulfurase n=1 Tax=Chitinivibrio alkaliphilus ACht1 TaxID=1313304 RepID=U7D9P2_9BACT|nr:cysteine desulfurase family protein [Chitinivibrio alkaliphilus]ERP31807.1 Aminotransferase, class V:Aromatic amino acid beta-eliminating lyase/threonine aldolase [Chitinivibrio alkaliphilus ACht1]